MKFAHLIPWRGHETSRKDAPVWSFRREMDRVFDKFLTEPFGFEGGNGAFSPTVDLTETDTSIDIKVELPGMDEKDVEILLDENMLTVRGEKKEESKRTDEGVEIKESSYGRFERVIPLPVEVQSEKVEATYKKGVLSVVMPKSEKAKSSRKKIPVMS